MFRRLRQDRELKGIIYLARICPERNRHRGIEREKPGERDEGE